MHDIFLAVLRVNMNKKRDVFKYSSMLSSFEEDICDIYTMYEGQIDHTTQIALRSFTTSVWIYCL